jgi:hypothetical protein
MAKIYLDGGLFGPRERSVTRRPEEATKEEFGEIGKGMAAAAQMAHDCPLRREERFTPEYVREFRGRKAFNGIAFVAGCQGGSSDIYRLRERAFFAGSAHLYSPFWGIPQDMPAGEFIERVDALAEDLKQVRRNPAHYTADQGYAVEKGEDRCSASIRRADGAISIDLKCKAVPLRHMLLLRKRAKGMLMQGKYDPAEAYGQIVGFKEENKEYWELVDVLEKHFTSISPVDEGTF